VNLHEEVVAKVAGLRAGAVEEEAEDDFERHVTIRHWPFDDFDEDE
jgi:hypothetical protein